MVFTLHCDMPRTKERMIVDDDQSVLDMFDAEGRGNVVNIYVEVEFIPANDVGDDMLDTLMGFDGEYINLGPDLINEFEGDNEAGEEVEIDVEAGDEDHGDHVLWLP